MSDSVIISIIGLAGALVGSLTFIVKIIVKVVENNTQVNDNVANTVRTIGDHLIEHSREVDTLAAEVRPALAMQKNIVEMLQTMIVTQKEIIQLIKEIKK